MCEAFLRAGTSSQLSDVRGADLMMSTPADQGTPQPIKENVVDKDALMIYLKSKLQPHMVPKRVIIEHVNIGHRFKKES